MTDPAIDTIQNDETILILKTRVLAWIFLIAIFAGGIFIIIDELKNTQPPQATIILIGVGVLIVPLIAGAISFGHRVHVYEDRIVSKSIFGTHQALINEITRVDRSLDYMHIRHADKKLIIVPTYLKNHYKLSKHLKQIAPNDP
tara:strand:- start:59 stop:490 length:432 start_codon:yes stop_codon:yes gene_type:complete